MAYFRVILVYAIMAVRMALWRLRVRIVTPLLVFITLVGLAFSAHAAPSFDCRNASSAVAALVCQTPALSDADRAMADAYYELLSTAGPKARELIKASQQHWLAALGPLCGLPETPPQPMPVEKPNPVACLGDLYRQRSPYVAPPLPGSEVAFPALRYPFLPTLTLNRDLALCRDFEATARTLFLQVSPTDTMGIWNDPDVFFEPWGRYYSAWVSFPGGQWLLWPSSDSRRHGSGEQVEDAEVDALTVDLDGDGHRETLLHIDHKVAPIGESDPHIYALAVVKPGQVETAEKEFQRWIDEQEPNDIDPSNASNQSFTPIVLEVFNRYFLQDSTIHVLRYQQRYYLQEGAQLSRIRGDGELATVCSVSTDSALPFETEPNPTGSPTGTSTVDPHDAVGPPFAALVDAIQRVQGDDDGMSHEHYMAGHIDSAALAEHAALVRPWTVMDKAPWPGPDETAKVIRYQLRQWSYESLANFRNFRRFTAADGAAKTALAGYYQRIFGLDAPAAADAGRVAVDYILHTAFYFYPYPDDSDIDDIDLTDQAALTDVAGGPDEKEKDTAALLRTGLLLGAPGGQLEALIADLPDLNRLYRPNDYTDDPTMEPVLDYALEHPALISLLLAHGADINAVNDWGKTPLMFAAHFDLPEAVTLLVQKGADVNRATVARDGFGYSMRYSERTALMYAAENASLPVIKTLIAAGADVSARDSGGRTIARYLALNPHLSASDRQQVSILAGWQPASPIPAKRP